MTSSADGRPSRPMIAISGGASGIGKAVARRLVAEGGSVVILDRDEVAGSDLAEELSASPGECAFVAVDLASPLSITEAATSVRSHGVLGGLVNAAGVGGQQTVSSNPLDHWQPIVDVNLRAPALLVHALLPDFAPEGGSIVNIASDGGLLARTGCWSYDATKAGVISLTRTMAAELVGRAIRVNAVAPGWTATEFHTRNSLNPQARLSELESQSTNYCLMGRLARASEIAGPVAFLLGPDSSFITGAVLCVDGGRVGFDLRDSSDPGGSE